MSFSTPRQRWLTLLVQLEPLHINPPIWRRLVVNSDCTLRKLHHFLQAAMGWSSSHLHEFSIGERRYLPPDPEMPDPDGQDDRRFKLHRLAVGDRLRYLYDFGDGWQHVIAVEAVEPAPQPGTFCAVLAGERACPPEDIGGVEGYAHLLQLLHQAPDSPEALEIREWLGSFDAELFDLRAADAAVQRICNNLWG